MDETADRLREGIARLRRSLRKKTPFGEVKPEDRKRAVKLTESGRHEYNVGLCDLAAELFEKAVRLDPRNQKALYSLGSTYYKQRRVKAALEKWRECIDVDPQNAIAGKARRRMQHVAKTGAHLEEELRELEEDLS